MGELLAGVGRRDVAPPLGIKTAGFYSRESVVQAIDGELSATVCVLRGLGQTVAIAAVDLCMAPQSLVARWRSSIASAVGTEPDHVLVNLSHTHSSAALSSTQPEFAYMRDLLDLNEARLGHQLVSAAETAIAGLRPARIGARSGTSDLGVQRREVDEDGYVFLGEVPDGPIDSHVGVIRIDDLAGDPIAVLASYGCHSVCVGPHATVASADFPGPARELVEEALGGMCLFLQGGGGDIMPRWGMAHEEDGTDGKRRVGLMLGGEVVAVAAAIRTHVERGERVSIASLLGPGQTMRPVVPVDSEPCTSLGALSASVALDLGPLPSELQAHELQAERVADLDAALASGSERAIQVARHFAAWADVLITAVREHRTTVEMEVQAIRINDIVITGIAAEAFSATTRAIRERSPMAHTMALGYSNGVLGYLPTADAYPSGGWDVRERYRIPDMVLQSYLLPVALRPDAESRIREAVLDLVAELASADGPVD
jgi:neutral ceramidase